jgi:hypothetical protein
MENQNESNNKSKKEEENKKQKKLKTNESIEIPLSKKSLENEKINDRENTEENINNQNLNNNEDITNIKYVTENQLDQIKQIEKEQKKNIIYSPNHSVTILDLQKNPNLKLIINSPRSLQALNDSGYTLDQLYHRTFDEFIEEHKELLHLDEEVRINRYHFYEKLRMDKINNLVEYREQLIQNELYQLNYDNNNQEENNKIKTMKNIILDNDKRIAENEISIIKKKYEKELANIIQLELDKDLFNLELKKLQAKYEKAYKKLNFLNFQSTTDIKENDEKRKSSLINIYPISVTSEKKNLKYFSLPKKTKICVDKENNYIDNLHTLQQTLINQKYEKKEKIVEQKLERLEKIRKITGEQRALKKRIGEERASQNLQKNAIDFLKRHEDLVTEIQNKKINIFQNKKKFENITKNKNEMNNLKYLIKMDSISDLRRKEEYIRMVKYYELLEKQSKTEQIKNDRINVIDNKLLKLDYLNNERYKNIIKIKEILNTGISEENLEKIIEQFPDNKEIKKVVKNYQNNKKDLLYNSHKTKEEKKISIKKRPKSHGKLYLNKINKNNQKQSKENQNLKIPNLLMKNKNNRALTETNKISNEPDVKEKLRLYKELLFKQFYKRVQQEKENEELRLKELEKIVDKNAKYQLEKKFRKERALVYIRLERENQKINDKISLYEMNLKNIKNKKNE